MIRLVTGLNDAKESRTIPRTNAGGRLELLRWCSFRGEHLVDRPKQAIQDLLIATAQNLRKLVKEQVNKSLADLGN